VGLQDVDQFERFTSVRGFPDHDIALLALEQHPQSFSEEALAIDQEYAASTTVSVLHEVGRRRTNTTHIAAAALNAVVCTTA
jgi:hypothetical protein